MRIAVAIALGMLLALVCAASALATSTYEKTPGGTSAQIASSVFYIAVNDGTNGAGDWLFYYFSLDELKDKYGVETRDFDYANHTVATTTSAHGFSITTLIDSLVDVYGNPLTTSVGLNDTWTIQYLEEDAFHATGAAYKDTIAAARDTTKPMLTFDIKETFTTPTKYNVNDAGYKWAENLYPEYLRVYRQTDSANSAVMKMMMGIAVSSDGLAYSSTTAGRYTLTGTDGLGNQVVLDSKGNPGRTVKGALAGMKIGVWSPTVAAYTATEDSQLISSVEPAVSSTQNRNFSYKANDYVTTKNWTTGATTTYTEYDIASATTTRMIPESLAYVQGLVASGEAASLVEASIDATTAEFTIPLPTRLLFVDTRVSPYAFGYTDLNLYRYSGDSAGTLAGVAAAGLTNVIVTDTDGAKTLFTGADAANCFIAYKDGHSKACPNNTAESKRFTWVYDHPKLIDENDGEVLVTSVASVDVNAPVVTALKISWHGKRSAKVHRGKVFKLVSRMTPATNVETLKWRSSKPGIAKVTATGKVKCSKKRTGRVVITATTTFGTKATFKVKVVN